MGASGSNGRWQPCDARETESHTNVKGNFGTNDVAASDIG